MSQNRIKLYFRLIYNRELRISFIFMKNLQKKDEIHGNASKKCFKTFERIKQSFKFDIWITYFTTSDILAFCISEQQIIILKWG